MINVHYMFKVRVEMSRGFSTKIVPAHYGALYSHYSKRTFNYANKLKTFFDKAKKTSDT